MGLDIVCGCYEKKDEKDEKSTNKFTRHNSYRVGSYSGVHIRRMYLLQATLMYLKEKESKDEIKLLNGWLIEKPNRDIDSDDEHGMGIDYTKMKSDWKVSSQPISDMVKGAYFLYLSP